MLAYFSMFFLFSQGKVDEDTPHHVPDLEIFLRTLGVIVMAPDAGMGSGDIGINGLIKPSVSFFDDPGKRFLGVADNFLQAGFFVLRSWGIFFIDGPKAGQIIPHSNSPLIG